MERPLSAREEGYARCVAAGMSYAEAFRKAGLKASTAGSMSSQIAIMNKTPRVRARILELKKLADSEIESTFAERASWLRLIVSADPDELTRVVREPCDSCWTDHEIAAAYGVHFAPTPFHEDRPPLPDTQKPRPSCAFCRGEGHTRVVVTPTDELSPAGRALFKGASQDDKGVIKIQMHDQATALDMLNRMHSSYVTRSLNMNVNAAVTPARDTDPQEALRLFDAPGGP